MGELDKYYYEEPVISFAATYKYYDWIAILIKLECLLMKINFVSAKMQLESEYEGHFNFFWKSKNHSSSFRAENNLIETDKWYFGVGHRDMWGILIENLGVGKYPIQPLNFLYPIEFPSNIKKAINKMILKSKDVPIGQKINLGDYIKDRGLLSSTSTYQVLLLLEWKDMINFSRNEKGGYWITKLKEIELVDTNVQDYIQRS